MSCDYQAIRDINKESYGTQISRIGPMLLTDRYADRTHFIFELLQNAEDAILRRSAWKGPRSVSFQLTKDALRVSHFGQPFNEADVRGVCGIGESTKNITSIGRFGIGFKSVYAFTDRPEIHSGTENFAIENFVWPTAATSLAHEQDETVILIPLKSTDDSAHDEIVVGLERLGSAALLFLRQIEEIHWSVEGGCSGYYRRETKKVASRVRRVNVIGQELEAPDIDETWLVFSRPVLEKGRKKVGYVEIAFSIAKGEKSGREIIQKVERSPLVVFFPTVVETHLGFLIQGPYRTTPSRDNIPNSDPFNQHLIDETALLLQEALIWLRDHKLLDTKALMCLPLDSTKFAAKSLFAPLFNATKKALLSESLLPRFDTGYVQASCALLARTQALRELFTPTQLALLYQESHDLVWLSNDINSAPELRTYMLHHLSIPEVIPETIIQKFNEAFLKIQPDDWILKLYEFLKGQPALSAKFDRMPLIRLEDGNHVLPKVNGKPSAFLPGILPSGFPTVRTSVCASQSACEFLRSLGLTEPDPVDDVIQNILPKYQKSGSISTASYEGDIRRIIEAFDTDSKLQREKLLDSLKKTKFVLAVDAVDGTKYFLDPGSVYLATERLMKLFAGVKGVFFVDNRYECLRGEDIRKLLEACGATRYIQPVACENSLAYDELKTIRIKAGCENTTGYYPIQNWTLRGLDQLLNLLPQLDPQSRIKRATLLWEALSELEDRRGKDIFSGIYSWFYVYKRSAPFEAAFVRKLNETAWVPDANGNLQRPEFILIDSLGWKANSLLESQIRFKPHAIEILAREAGFEPGVLDLLKKFGLTSETELRMRLNLRDESQKEETSATKIVEDPIKKRLGDATDSNSVITEPRDTEFSKSEGSVGTDGAGMEPHNGIYRDKVIGLAVGEGNSKGAGPTKSTSESKGVQQFISYVAVDSEKEESDPDGLVQEERMALETCAIDLILSQEPEWLRTPVNNPGYDLYQVDEHGQVKRWCEIKAMSKSLHDRPVGLSYTQFEYAQNHGEAYWLYVVEYAGTDSARIVRIQNPAGKAHTFTFDHGWLEVADFSEGQENKRN